MKKITIFLSALCLITSAMAAEVQPKAIIDFSDSTNVWNFPTEYAADTAEYTYQGQTVKMYYGTAKDGYKISKVKASKTTPAYSYLIFGKTNCKIELPAFSFRVGKIVAYGTTSAGEKVETNVFVGETAVSTKQVGAKLPNQLPTFVIDTAYRAVGNKYAIKVLSAHNMQITKIQIFEEVAGAPENPVFSPKGGTYTSAQTVSLTCPTDGATIQYSYDGSTYLDYSAPLSVENTQTIYAKAVKNTIESDVVTATYQIVATQGKGTKDDPYTIEDVQKLGNPGDSAWVTGVIMSCAATGGKRAAKDTTDANILLGKTISDSIGVPVALPTKTIKNALGLETNPGNKGKTVKVYGALVSYFGVNGVKNTSDYELTIPAGTPDKPTFSVPEGTYFTAQTVTISCATDGASLYYKLGSADYQAYTQPVQINKTDTLYAKAVKNELTSDIAKAIYVIYTPQGAGTKDDPYTVADLVAFNNPGDSAWVEGYIIGCASSNGKLLVDSVNNNNVLIADSPVSTEGAPVKLSTDTLKNNVGLVGHPERIGKLLKVYGKLEKYLSKQGVINVSEFDIEGGTTLLEINNIPSNKAVKIIQNGQVFILRNGEKYNALGIKQ